MQSQACLMVGSGRLGLGTLSHLAAFLTPGSVGVSFPQTLCLVTVTSEAQACSRPDSLALGQLLWHSGEGICFPTTV